MDKNQILEILNDWNYWKKELDSGRKRKSYLERCLRFLKSNVVVSLIGVRRSGKSYIMRQMIKKLIEEGLSANNTLFINLEDRRFTEFYPALLDEIYGVYLDYLKPDERHLVFLDEIHNVPKWERWARTIHELGKAKIIVSGSSSKLLSGELATVLTGRHLDVLVFPLSFREFLCFNNIELKDSLDIITKKSAIKSFLREYMEFGGFPEVLFSQDKKQLLLTYFDDILTKDIEKRHKLRKSEKLRSLARFYLTNISNTITFNSIKGFLDTTTTTIEKFSSYLQEAYVIFFVKRFSFKVKEQEKSARKVYAVDVGLSNSVGFKFSSNFGFKAENIVALSLKKKAEDSNLEVFYWHDALKREVDFVIKQNKKIEKLIQVCWNIEEYKTKEREVNNLLKASKELRCNNLIVITEDYENTEKIKKGRITKKIDFVPLWKWLLGED